MEAKELMFFEGLKYEVDKFIKGSYEKFWITASIKNNDEVKKLLNDSMLHFCKENKISILMRTPEEMEFNIYRRKDYIGNWVYREQMPLNIEI